MPLSKKRQAEWMRNYRKAVIPSVIPNDDSPQSISRGIKGEADSTVPPVSVQPIPNCPDGRYRDK